MASGLRKDTKVRYIQTTTPISPGSSGEGLFDYNGKLVGIKTMEIAEANQLGFAVAIDELLDRTNLLK